MELLTDIQASHFFQDYGIIARTSFPYSAVFSSSKDNDFHFTIKIPAEFLKTVALSYVVIMTGVIDDVEENFQGGMLWFTDWNIWHPGIEGIAMNYLKGIRSVEDVESSVNNNPYQLFESNELILARSALVVPMLFQWNAYFIPKLEGLMFFIHQHGYMEVITDTRERYEEYKTRFMEGEWEFMTPKS